jgi:hypothetical protein
MGGKKMRLEKVVAPKEDIPEEEPDAPPPKKSKKTVQKSDSPKSKGATVVSLADRKPGKDKKK